jgi:exopolyphosphatase/guanosine-5'-triphosphate,3'-diphosphate pyrophosphatase
MIVQSRDVAVIDIGSNSVRLVHFRVAGRALLPVYNEKVMAGLGMGVRETGRLNPEGVEIADRAMKRFERLLNARQVSECHVVATAAVRNAEDGADFVADIATRTGLETRVLSGREEGELSARGLLAGLPGADGVMGDLGGSSLELARIGEGEFERAQTLALGPQEIMMTDAADVDRAQALVEAGLAGVDLLDGSKETFYAVGGAWRTLAQLAFGELGYPLRVVHGFRVSAEDLADVTRYAITASAETLEKLPGISRRRATSLPYAALLLDRLVKRGGFKNVVFSAYGLREGVVASGMDTPARETEALVAGVRALSESNAQADSFSDALCEWLGPAWEAVGPAFARTRDKTLAEAASCLVDLGARLHPDHRCELARDSVLYGPFADLTHEERVFLAAVTHHRYGGRRRVLDQLPAFGLLTAEQRALAVMLGTALRLGAKLSGRSAALLARSRLCVEPDWVRLEVDEDMRDLYVERSIRLLTNLANAVGRQADVRYR